MKKYFLLVGSLLFALQCIGQSTNISTFFRNNEEKGDYFFDRFAYRNALGIYQQRFNHDPDNYRVRERIAICYTKLHDPASAELWYRALSREPELQPETMFRYAEVLSMNGKYDESKHWFRQYLTHHPGDGVAEEKAAFLDNIEKYTITDRFVMSLADFNPGFENAYSAFGAHFFHEGIVFASTRDMDLLVKHKPVDALSDEESLLNLYYAEKNENGGWDNSVLFAPRALKTPYNDGPIAFFDHYQKGAFTRSVLKNGRPVYDATGKVNVGIYFATIRAAGAVENVIPFEYNSEAYSNANPSFSPDGKVMYFTSTMPAGFGGGDLYYSTFRKGRWSEPVNVGDRINTRMEESFPFLANDTTLYFSSTGHGGLGGLDIYVSYKRNGVFTKPLNLGSPVNSGFDDFSFVTDSLGRTGYLSSNVEGDGRHDRIFRYVARFYFVMGEVHELNAGQKPIPGARISAFNSNGDLIDSARSDHEGSFVLNLPFDQDFSIRGEKEGFETLRDTPFSTRGKPFGVDSLALPMWRKNLFSRGRIFSNETQSILPGTRIIISDLTEGTSDSLLVDEKGEYEFPVRPGRRYRIAAAKEGYISNGFSLNTNDLIDGELLNDIVLEEIYIGKEVILFDYDEAVVTGDAAKQMNELVRTLRRYPRATVNVGAHADSRGTHAYNMRLSKRRAEATRAYLVSKGIAASRIELTWFGEELVLNRCSDGVECPEEEHSKNRRAELKVQTGDGR